MGEYPGGVVVGGLVQGRGGRGQEGRVYDVGPPGEQDSAASGTGTL